MCCNSSQKIYHRNTGLAWSLTAHSFALFRSFSCSCCLVWKVQCFVHISKMTWMSAWKRKRQTISLILLFHLPFLLLRLHPLLRWLWLLLLRLRIQKRWFLVLKRTRKTSSPQRKKIISSSNCSILLPLKKFVLSDFLASLFFSITFLLRTGGTARTKKSQRQATGAEAARRRWRAAKASISGCHWLAMHSLQRRWNGLSVFFFLFQLFIVSFSCSGICIGSRDSFDYVEWWYCTQSHHRSIWCSCIAWWTISSAETEEVQGICSATWSYRWGFEPCWVGGMQSRAISWFGCSEFSWTCQETGIPTAAWRCVCLSSFKQAK